MRFSNAAVHRKAVCQLQGKVYIDHNTLRFEMAHNDPKPLNRETKWCFDRYRPSRPLTIVGVQIASNSTQLLNNEQTSPAA